MRWQLVEALCLCAALERQCGFVTPALISASLAPEEVKTEAFQLIAKMKRGAVKDASSPQF